MPPETEHFFKRTTLFGIAGLFIGAMVGLVNGVLAGASHGCLMELAGITPLLFNNHFDIRAVVLGATFGGIYGAGTGAVIGMPTWVLVGIMQWRRSDVLNILRHTMRGSLRTSLIMTTAGAVSGTVLVTAYWCYGSHPTTRTAVMEAALAPINGGFFTGSILGCAVGIILGAVLGARPEANWLNVPIREVPNALKQQLLYLIGK